MYYRKRRLGIKTKLYLFLCFVIIAAAAAGIFAYMTGMLGPGQQTPVECDHKWKTLREKEATCDEAGAKYLRCEYCMEEKETPIKALGHKLVATVETPATCLAPGRTASERCTRITCSYSKSPAIIPQLEHNYVTMYETPVDPTCTSNGYSGGEYCSMCHTVSVQPEVIPALVHNYVPADDVPATCKTEGAKGGTWCEFCHKYDQQPTEIIPVVTDGHTGNIVDTDEHGNKLAATCTSDAYGYCDECGASVLVEAMNSDKHTWVMTSEGELPDCRTKTDGVTATYECTDCHLTLGGDVISHELCHTEGSKYCLIEKNASNILDPTETSAGLAVVTCKGGCGLTYKVDIPALGSGDFNTDNDVFPDGILGKEED